MAVRLFTSVVFLLARCQVYRTVTRFSLSQSVRVVNDTSVNYGRYRCRYF